MTDKVTCSTIVVLTNLHRNNSVDHKWITVTAAARMQVADSESHAFRAFNVVQNIDARIKHKRKEIGNKFQSSWSHAQQRIDSLYFRIDYKATLCKLGEEKEAKNNEITKA